MLSENFTESEVHLIVQGLDLLFTSKRGALRKVADVFSERDFGIPQIMELQAKIDSAMVVDEPESEVSA